MATYVLTHSLTHSITHLLTYCAGGLSLHVAPFSHTYERILPHYFHYTHEGLSSLLEDAGFEVSVTVAGGQAGARSTLPDEIDPPKRLSPKGSTLPPVAPQAALLA